MDVSSEPFSLNINFSQASQDTQCSSDELDYLNENVYSNESMDFSDDEPVVSKPNFQLGIDTSTPAKPPVPSSIFDFSSSYSTPKNSFSNQKSKYSLFRSDSYEESMTPLDGPFPSGERLLSLKRSPNDISSIPETPAKSLEKHSRFKNNPDDEEFIPLSRFLADFDDLGIIGTGSFGTVFRARSRLDGAMYAIKRSNRKFRGNSDKLRMMHEVHALAALSFREDCVPTIVRYSSTWIEEDLIYIQMELCDDSVEHLINSGTKFTEQTTFAILRDMLIALNFLHRNDFVHLDLKPANIFRKGGHYKLGDFGLAVHVENRKASPALIEEGDCRYMALELLNSNIEDLTKCDIFSLGITAYEIVSEIPVPMNGDRWRDLRSGKLDNNVVLSQEIRLVLLDLMNPTPVDRPNASECLEKYDCLKSPEELLNAEKDRRLAELESQINENRTTESIENTCQEEIITSARFSSSVRGLRRYCTYS